MSVSELSAGFTDKVLSAQSTFRSVMEAMARPGSVQRVAAEVGAAAGLMPAVAAIALTLCDHDTPVWLDPQLEAKGVAEWLKFHTGAPVTAASADASFALVTDAAALPALDSFALGSSEYPDRSTTVILQVESLSGGRAYDLRGPGIDGVATLNATIAPDDLLERLAVNASLFPRGIDVVLVHGDALVAIPRTTRLAGG
ncbi:MAG: phosphonate C-P lyase system protein PhnH [Bradyrhizobium sp.]|jgi:alpha-D-ribose 1-methylphosphonate 5-triphosphate synthase subunit PhnH|uniref:phosphonate C-P lyase system protein PhnH n=1 Tax=Bradyrhizobium sp. TaxID=376 RepID=UPI003C7CF8FC